MWCVRPPLRQQILKLLLRRYFHYTNNKQFELELGRGGVMLSPPRRRAAVAFDDADDAMSSGSGGSGTFDAAMLKRPCEDAGACGCCS